MANTMPTNYECNEILPPHEQRWDANKIYNKLSLYVETECLHRGNTESELHPRFHAIDIMKSSNHIFWPHLTSMSFTQRPSDFALFSAHSNTGCVYVDAGLGLWDVPMGRPPGKLNIA